ncbi:restriction endonuclease subunit S [Sinorhizobium meliloti]|uniref:restriction endonuclease subunit S n=1 Tax=Rhizobium meliloti TaxID=382 RepID=UPI00237FFC43|nr:restriction endonuclease subunit S [Sinorhizobium meliloti]MDE3796452.1 restriction endonuclease subunit S [Sinorhizobium meliloti]
MSAPARWDELRLGDVAARTKNIDPSAFPDEVFELYSVPSFSEGSPEIVPGTAIKSAKQAVEPGDVLLCKIVPHINRVWVVGEKSDKRQIASGEWIVYRGHGCDPSYLRCCLTEQSFRDRFMQTVAGVGGSLMRARPSEVAEIMVPLAPLEEQRRIVAKIDSLVGKSRRARGHLHRVPRLIDRYKQAVLAAAFRGDLTRDWRTLPANKGLVSPLLDVREQRSASPLSERRRKALNALPPAPDDFNELPTGWQWACIEEIASDEPMSIQSGPFGSSLLHSEFTDEGKLVIGIDNVQDGYFSPGAQHRIPDKKFEELRRFQARPEDVLITVMATIGRVCVLPPDIEAAIITKHVYRITVDRRLTLPRFVAFGLRGSEAALEHMGANVRGQTRPGLNGEIVKATYLPLPPLAEQLEIIGRIEKAFNWIDRLAFEATSARRLIDHLDQAVLAKAVRGELVPQDPNDEPAITILERIAAERPNAPNTRGRKRSV